MAVPNQPAHQAANRPANQSASVHPSTDSGIDPSDTPSGAPRATPRRVLLSTVSSDAHTWNLVFLQLLLSECGYEVINLGPCVPDELLVASVREYRPDLVVISTVNGHGGLDGARAVRLLRADPTTARVPAVIGGKLGIEGPDDSTSRELVEAGFDAVFTDATDPSALPEHLELLMITGSADDVGPRSPEYVA